MRSSDTNVEFSGVTPLQTARDALNALLKTYKEEEQSILDLLDVLKAKYKLPGNGVASLGRGRKKKLGNGAAEEPPRELPSRGRKRAAVENASKGGASPADKWDEIYKRLGKTFTLDDVLRLGNFEKKRAAVMGIARWVRFKRITKSGDGKYLKVA